MLDYMLRALGPPRQVQLVCAEAAAYKDRVPRVLSGSGRSMGAARTWMACIGSDDPAPFRAVFKDQPAFVSSDMTAVSYTAFGDLKGVGPSSRAPRKIALARRMQIRFTCPGIGSAGESGGTARLFDLAKRLEGTCAGSRRQRISCYWCSSHP